MQLQHLLEGHKTMSKMEHLLQFDCWRWIHTGGELMIGDDGKSVCRSGTSSTWQDGNPQPNQEQEVSGKEVIIHACGADSSPDRSVQWMVCKYSRTNI